MKHANVAIFVPHNGCPNQCSFCEQRNITGISYQPNLKDIREAIDIALQSLSENVKNAEIAFFGGSFTAIDRDYMMELLDCAYECVKLYSFAGIRISTRPDAIDNQILDILKDRAVTSIELGAQSMNDKVLDMNNRGHTSLDVKNASQLIKEKGFSLGLQMMTGLYGSNQDIDYETGKQIVNLHPDTVRIYPTIIMKNTLLHELYKSKVYMPMGFDEMVSLCSRLLNLFNEAGIQVIRLGLHNVKSLNDNMVAGSWHPSFKEICESKIFIDKIIKYLNFNKCHGNDIIITINPKDVSKVVGYKKCNLHILNNMGYKVTIKQDSNVNLKEFIIK